jgi:hypothetical protein
MKRIGAPGITGNSIPTKPIKANIAPNTERIIDSIIAVLADHQSGKNPPDQSSMISFSADIKTHPPSSEILIAMYPGSLQ